jgi:hypothetical protein
VVRALASGSSSAQRSAASRVATIVRLVTPVPPFERPHQNGTLPALRQQRRDVRCGA